MLVHFLHEFNLFLPLKYGIQIDVKMQFYNDSWWKKNKYRKPCRKKIHFHIYKKTYSTILKLQINATNCVYFKGALLIIKPQGTSIKKNVQWPYNIFIINAFHTLICLHKNENVQWMITLNEIYGFFKQRSIYTFASEGTVILWKSSCTKRKKKKNLTIFLISPQYSSWISR